MSYGINDGVTIYMSHFIVRNDAGKYLYSRRDTGNSLPGYERRTVYGPRLQEARVFTTRSAARNASLYEDDLILPVLLRPRV